MPRRDGLWEACARLRATARGASLDPLGSELWINKSDSYSNFALLLAIGWAFVVGVGAGLELARRRDMRLPGRPGALVIAALLYGAIPVAVLAIAIGAAQSLVRAVI